MTNMSSTFEHTVDAMTKCMEEFQCVYDFDLNAIKSDRTYNAAVEFIELCTEVTLRTYKEDKYVVQDPQVKRRS